jgi:hypothetical protein
LKWLAKQRREVMDKWRKNELSMAGAASELMRLGYSPDQAWAKLVDA